MENINNDVEFNTCYTNYKNSYYPSNIVGQLIVDAVTGAEYTWKVGSYQELRFFKVTDTSDIMESNGKKSFNKKTPNFLYYESPEAYMKHKDVILEESVVENWHSKYNILFPNHVFDYTAYKLLY